MSDAGPAEWAFHKFALIVTGHGEREHLPKLFRPLTTEGRCSFQVVHQFGQRSPISSARRLKMVGKGKRIPDKDEGIGLKARACLSRNGGFDFVLLVDDLEQDRVEDAEAVYRRYREALDALLSPVGLAARASVHFLVNMLEAYYFADSSAMNSVLETTVEDHSGDVETIRHPKNEIKKLVAGRGFDERKDGGAILGRLNIDKVLSRPETCRSLRTAFAWCRRAMGEPATERFRLLDGEPWPVTAGQLDRLP